MDRDQELDAGGDPSDTATSAGGYGGCEDSWARALLRRGWDLSRKAAIAGVAATAAPVIAPPIMILSVASVALSVPFAAYLASLAATDRLMAALLPPSTEHPYHAYDIGDGESEQEFVDAWEALGEEVPVSDYRSKTEEGSIMEENEGFPSLPLSPEPRHSEELAPLLPNEEDEIAGDEFAIQKSGHELFIPNNGEKEEKMEEDNEYITMEALPLGDVFGSAAPVLGDEDNMVGSMEDAAIPAQESVRELPVRDRGLKTEDGKSTITEEMESSKEMTSQGVNATDLDDSLVPMLGGKDIMVQREGEAEVSVQKSGHHSRVSDSGDKTEQHKTTQDMPLREVNVSGSSVSEDGAFWKMKDEVTVDRMLEEVTSNADPVSEEVVDVQMDVIATAVTGSESLQSSDLAVTRELLSTMEAAYVYGTSTEGFVKDIGDRNTGGVEHHGERGICSVVSMPLMVTVDDEKDLLSSRSTPNVSGIADNIMSVESSRPPAEHPHQTTGAANKEFGKKELAEDKCVKTERKTMEGKVHSTNIAAQDIDVPKSPMLDDQRKREDEVTVDKGLEEVTNNTDLLTEVVSVQVDIFASESESLPLSDLMARESHAVAEATTVDNICERTEREDSVKGTGDTNIEGVEHHIEGAACSFVLVTSLVTMGDDEDLTTSRNIPYVSALNNDMTSVEGRKDVDKSPQTSFVEYKADEGFGRNVAAEGKDIYMEEQLREQLDTLRKITGYRAVPSLTLEGELAGLYMFVGVEPPVNSRASDLTELNRKLLFLKSIIGVE